jgi:hypothetical protein
LMLILSDSSAPASSERAVTTIDAMQLNDNDPQISGFSDIHSALTLDSSRDFAEFPPRDYPIPMSNGKNQKKSQRDFDHELRLHAGPDQQSLERDACIPISNMPFHGDTVRYLETASDSTVAHVVADARADVAKVWDDFLASLAEPDAVNSHNGLSEPTELNDPSRRLCPVDVPMPPPKRFYHYVWRSFGRKLLRPGNALP